MDLSKEGGGVCDVDVRRDILGLADSGANESRGFVGEIGLGRCSISGETEQREEGIEGERILGLFTDESIK